MVNIYYLKLNDFSLTLEDLDKITSSVRIVKLKSIKDENSYKQSLAVEAVLQYAFYEYGFSLPKEYAYLMSGKPIAEDVYFSLAHTDGAVIVAVSNNPVGIDIEKKRQIKDISSKILTLEEQEFYALNKESDYLLDTFVRKESYFKMTGEGIGNNMHEVSINEILNNSRQVALCFDDYLSIISTKAKDLYDVTKVTENDLRKLLEEVEDE